MFQMRARRFGFWINGLQPHNPHQSLDSFTVDIITQPAQMISHGAAAPCGFSHVLLIDEVHLFKVQGLNWPFFIVNKGVSSRRFDLPIKSFLVTTMCFFL